MTLIYAILPIRHNSVRVPQKNYRKFNGKPLYQYILETLLSFKKISKIIIDTNSPIVKEGIVKNYSLVLDKIIIYNRPIELSSGDTPVNKLLINVIEKLNLTKEPITFLQTHTTNPLLQVSTIEQALDKYLSSDHDSLFTVKKLQTRLYTKKENIQALNHNMNELLPTQELEPLFEENSCLYIFTYNILKSKNHRIGYTPQIYIMDDLESTDIDTESDFKIAELLYQNIFLPKKLKTNVIITGICGGIGREIAKKYKELGWYIIGIDISNKNIPVCDDYLNQDISTIEGCREISRKINQKYDSINCIINNAAYQKCNLLKDFDEDEWELTYNTNVRPCYLLSKYLYKLLLKENGSIINISSVHSINTSKKIACYASSKGSLSALTRAMSLEFAEDNIRVNSICPGAIRTPMLEDGLRRNKERSMEENLKILESKHPCNFIGEPNDIAEMCIFLSDNSKSRYIYGQNFVVDGGATIKLSTE